MADSYRSRHPKATGGVSRFQGKMGAVKISTKAIPLILANSGKPIFAETGRAKAQRWIFAISRESGRSIRTSGSIFTIGRAAPIMRAA